MIWLGWRTSENVMEKRFPKLVADILLRDSHWCDFDFPSRNRRLPRPAALAVSIKGTSAPLPFPLLPVTPAAPKPSAS